MSHGPASATANDREELGTDDCMRRLAAAHVGHLGFTAKALPVVTPIRYLLCGKAIVFATGSTTELRSARNHAVACVGISGVDQSTGAEWTVLATGRLRDADDSATSAGAQALPPAWGAPDAKRFIALDIELLNGCATRPQ